MGEIETVICSPMKRTIQTMQEGLECLLGDCVSGKRPNVEFDAGWQGKPDHFYSLFFSFS
jgi:broad specificity phosphatase PhoE